MTIVVRKTGSDQCPRIIGSGELADLPYDKRLLIVCLKSATPTATKPRI